jgi:Putative metallopeptidase
MINYSLVFLNNRIVFLLFLVFGIAMLTVAQDRETDWTFPSEGMRGEYSKELDAKLYDIGNGFHAAHVVIDGKRFVVVMLPPHYEEIIAGLARDLGLSSYDKMFVGGALSKIVKTPDNPDDFYINTDTETGAARQHYRTKTGAEILATIGPGRTSIVAWLATPTNQNVVTPPESRKGTTVLRSSSQVSVEVSQLYSAVHYTKLRTLLPGEIETVLLQAKPYKDSYKAILKVRGASLRLLALDHRDVITRNAKPSILMNQLASGSSLATLPTLPSEEGVDVVLKNETQTPVSLDFVVYRARLLSAADRQWIKDLLEMSVTPLDKVFKLPRFKIKVAPCGSVNAYSDPDVTICTELIADLVERELQMALTPILLHEMAHSLLYLWGLPGHDNEDIADEFAAFILGKDMAESTEAYIKWLESNDSVTEAVIQLVNGDRHTISIQRARNMKAALLKADELELRWAKLLTPFARK